MLVSPSPRSPDAYADRCRLHRPPVRFAARELSAAAQPVDRLPAMGPQISARASARAGSKAVGLRAAQFQCEYRQAILSLLVVSLLAVSLLALPLLDLKRSVPARPPRVAAPRIR